MPGLSLIHILALGDLDLDGDVDAFVGNYPNQADEVWLNDGHGVFTDSTQRLGLLSTLGVALVDVNDDSRLDAVTGYVGRVSRVWMNDGVGNFALGQALGSASTTAVRAADLDGDGLPDLWFGNFGQSDQVWFCLLYTSRCV